MVPMQQLSTIWRVVRDVDLQAIRESVRKDVVLLVIAEDPRDAEGVRRLITAHPGSADTDPVIVCAPATLDVSALPVKPTAALCVTRTTTPVAPLADARRQLSKTGVPVVTIILGESDETPAVAPLVRFTDRVRLGDLGAPDAAAHLSAALASTIDPDVRLALARQLPILRPAVFEVLTEETARANAGFAFTTGLAEVVPVLTAPMNVGDIIVLTKNQLLMSYRIALAGGRDDDPRQMIGEILGVLGSGLLFRQVARQLVGLVPVIGLLPKVAVAYGGTWAIGRAMVAWITQGRVATADAVRAWRAEGLARGREIGKRLLDARNREHGPERSDR